MVLDLDYQIPPSARTDFAIGVIGAGFIVREVQLKAYRNAGFTTVAIASRTPEIAREVADLYGIPKVYDTVGELLRDPQIEIVDVAVPPDQQLAVIREVARHASHVRGVLVQKPLALNYSEAVEIVRICRESGIRLAVNQNMRYDQSIRALKSLLKKGYLGEPVLATIDMRAVPHWQPWVREYSRLTLLNMSVHHLDCFRFLFGEPECVYASVRPSPRIPFPHQDGICLYILEYASGLRVAACDDTYVGPGNHKEDLDSYIKWRVEGTEGLAQGWLGWPEYPNRAPSRMEFSSRREPGVWQSPRWREVWFPDAFEGPMGALMDSVARGIEPEISGEDNLHSMALVEACYASVERHQPVSPREIEAGAVVGGQ
jgi:predicted dehydrogenase